MASPGWKDGLSLVFTKSKYKLAFAALAILLIPFYAILTDIIIVGPPISLNPNLKIPEALLIFTVAILAALGFTIAAFQFFEFHSVSKKSVGGSVIGAGAGGSVLAAFASACTVCQPIWLVWLGLGGASAFLTDYSIYIALFSILVLLYSIQSGMKSIVACPSAKKGKRK